MGVVKWEQEFSVTFESYVGASEYILCRWELVPHSYASMFFNFAFVFGQWSSGKADGGKSGDGNSRRRG